MKKKTYGLTGMIMLLVLAAALTACTKAPAPSNTDNKPANSETKGNENKGNENNSPQKEIKQGKGTYNGQQDSHSIEIQTADGPTPFQIEADLADVLDDLQLDEPVTFEYYEKAIEGDDTVKQLILTKLEKVNKNEDDAGGNATNKN
ncbi:hypothetical protein [Paenibacillus sp. GCM10027626]|uniref:hypothetical protein n=1 Tax=Paenibacillus sp. GCM10027626 TaxID=3273411 RepID=UPI003645D5C7